MYCLFERTDAGIAEEYRHVRPIDHLEALRGPGMVLDVDLYARCQSGELGVPPKLMLEVDPARREQHIADIKALCGDQVYIAWAIPDRVEFMRRGVDKGVALRTLTERIGGSTDRVLAVGDADNDLPMLRAAGTGVLLGNAKAEVQAAVAGDGCGLDRVLPKMDLPKWCGNTRWMDRSRNDAGVLRNRVVCCRCGLGFGPGGTNRGRLPQGRGDGKDREGKSQVLHR